MSTTQYAWVTRAPADYAMVFQPDLDGEHAIVTATFSDHDEACRVGHTIEGAGIHDAQLRVYCSLPGEAERVGTQLAPQAECVLVEDGELMFVAVGDGTGTDPRTILGDAEVPDGRVVFSHGGESPRRYSFRDCCAYCREFVGKIHVLPQGGVLLDTRESRCRCQGIPCRYCDHGSVRRPLTDHIDVERRAGHAPWFNYLVPCGHCQVAGRGPRVVMSARLSDTGA